MVNFMLCVFYHNKKFLTPKQTKKDIEKSLIPIFLHLPSSYSLCSRLSILLVSVISFQVFFLQMQVNMKLYVLHFLTFKKVLKLFFRVSTFFFFKWICISEKG